MSNLTDIVSIKRFILCVLINNYRGAGLGKELDILV